MKRQSAGKSRQKKIFNGAAATRGVQDTLQALMALGANGEFDPKPEVPSQAVGPDVTEEKKARKAARFEAALRDAAVLQKKLHIMKPLSLKPPQPEASPGLSPVS